jgi:hypothetical protein
LKPSVALTQAAILKAVYDATEGENWKNNTQWGTPSWVAEDSDICDNSAGWFGVTCNSNNKIKQLQLSKCTEISKLVVFNG